MKKILIAEDSKLLSAVLRDRFKEDGWDVDTAEDGENAIQKIRKGSYDLVLLDLVMPKKDGLEVLKEIKGDPEFKDLPIIVLSGLGEDETIKKAIKLGADDYYVKSQHPTSEVIEKAKKYQGMTGDRGTSDQLLSNESSDEPEKDSKEEENLSAT